MTPSWVSTVAVAATPPVICSTRRIMSRRDMMPVDVVLDELVDEIAFELAQFPGHLFLHA